MNGFFQKFKLFVFDLDDTLYDEFQFVCSGFDAVSEVISEDFGIDKDFTYSGLIRVFKNYGRGKVFNQFFLENKIVTDPKYITKLVDIYRFKQKYQLNLFHGVENFIKKIKKNGSQTALLTDTNWNVQEKKVESLKLDKIIDNIYYSDKYGLKKPDTILYEKILDDFKIDPKYTVWVGDDPRCDFFIPNLLGAFTIRIQCGRLKDIQMEKEYDAMAKIDDFISINNIYN